MNRLVPVTAVLTLALLLGLVAIPGAVLGQDTTAERSFDTETPTPGENVTVTMTIDLDESAEVTVIEEFDPAFASTELVSITVDEEEVSTLLRDATNDSVVVPTEAVGPGILAVTYKIQIPSEAVAGAEYRFDATVEVGGETIPVVGDSTLTVGSIKSASFMVSLDTPDAAVVGENLTAEYTVENTGSVGGTQDIVFSIDGNQVDTVPVTVSAGETITGRFEYIPNADEGPEIELAVASKNATASLTLTVESPPVNESGNGEIDDSDDRGQTGTDEAAANDSNGDGSGPGFAVFGVVFATALLTVYGVSGRQIQK